MSSETLRRAAALMRERAEETCKPENRHPWSDRSFAPFPPSGWSAEVEGYLGGPMGAHCASWHPAVALAVAGLLDMHAEGLEEFNEHERFYKGSWAEAQPNEHFLAVARAYLGGPDA